MQIGAKLEMQELCPECLFEPTLISYAFVSVGFHILEVFRWFLFTPCVDMVQPSSYITLLSKIKMLGTGVLKNLNMLLIHL